MKLFGTLSCAVGSSLVLFAVITGFTPKFDPGSYYFTSKLNKQAITYGDSADSNQPEVIVINEEERACYLPAAGFGMGGTLNGPREIAEKEFRQNNFREAAKLFEDIVQHDPYDIRSRLGLGKTYVLLHKFDDAILFLSTVRNECHRERYVKHPNSGYARYTSVPVQFSNLASLPEQACEAIDQEARVALETAVTASIKPKLPDSNSVGAFKNDRHFQVLNASLQLARQYHDKSQLEQLKAMYQLAGENTRTLPIELVTACSQHEKTNEKKWQELARLSLNGAVEEEKKWFLDRLAIVSKAFPEGDIKIMALNHTVLRDKQDLDTGFTPYMNPKDLKNALHRHSPHHALSIANSAFDYGFRSYRRCQTSEAMDFFLLAREIYLKCGTAKDLSDTNYNLGIINYQLERIPEAKRFFQLAAGIYKGKKRFEQDELKAAFNFGILSVELNEPGDEEYLSNLYDETHHPEAATLLGLHYLRKNDFEKAYAPFKHASLAKFPDPVVDMPELPCEPNYRRRGPAHHDRAFTDNQVLEAMFVRQKLIEESVSSRFATGTISCADDSDDMRTAQTTQQLTKERYPSFSFAVNALFPTILRKTNRDKELQEFLNPSKPKKGGYYKVANRFNEGQRYFNRLSATLKKTWFCPPHALAEQIVVHVQVNKDGTLMVAQNDIALTEVGSMNSAVGDSIRWTALPAPPPSYAGKKLILVYNACRATGLPLSLGIPLRGIHPSSEIEW